MRTTQIMHFPRKYKTLIMDVLAEYQAVRTSEHQSAGKRGTIGWQKLAAEILGSQERLVRDTDVKTLKSAIEAHQSGKAIISDSNFNKIHRFVMELDARGSIEAARRKAIHSRREHQRAVIGEVLGKPLPPEAATTIKLADGATFIVTDEGENESFYSVVMSFSVSENHVFDIDTYFFAGSFKEFVATTRTSGAILINGFAVLNGLTRDDDFFTLLPSRYAPSHSTPMVATGTALLSGPAILTGSSNTQMGFNFKIGGQTDKAGKKVILKLTPITAPMNLFYRRSEISALEKSSYYKYSSLLGQGNSIDAKQVTDDRSVQYIMKLKQKLDPEQIND